MAGSAAWRRARRLRLAERLTVSGLAGLPPMAGWWIRPL